jgi:hypothetical protein
VPAYYVELNVGRTREPDSAMWAYVVSARDRDVLFAHDLTAHEAFTYRVWADKDGAFMPWDSPHGNDFSPHPTGRPDGTDPTLKPSSLVTLQNAPFSRNDPWLPAMATETRGNNVNAYADIVAPDGFGMGDIAVTTTGPRTFDRTFDPSTKPQATPDTRRATTTHLFYVLNYLHDIYYDAGWDERSQNPQQDNYGRGGTGGDPINAEAQDHSGRNNANASTPADGRSPRIQMYLWDSIRGKEFRVSSPMDLAGAYRFGSASFGPATFMLTADAVIVDDGVMTRGDGCEVPFVNAAAVAGRIAIIDRGNCPFQQKAVNAQNAGAKGVVIVNNVAGPAPGMAGTAGLPAVTIPTVSLSLEDGGKIKTRLMGGAAVTLNLTFDPIDIDASLDTGIIAHEWAHVLSNRLVGNGGGLSTLQARGMGEGWSDFVALLTITRPEDVRAPANANWNGVYAAAAYSVSDPGTDAYYYGIRRYPYSSDLSKNPLTFKHIQRGVPLPMQPPPAFGQDGGNNPEVHNTGEVWGSMLWDCYTALLRDSARYTFDQATRRMRQYLVAGLKMTPSAPTILEARDALLSVIYAAEPKDFALCYQAFTRRGAGPGARGPERANPDHLPVTESFTAGTDLQFVSAAIDDSVRPCDGDGVLDNGEVGKLTIKIRNIGSAPLQGATATVVANHPGVFVRGKVSFPAAQHYETVTGSAEISMTGAAPLQPFTLHLSFDDPGFAVKAPVPATVDLVGGYDDLPAASATDTFEAANSPWSTAGDTMRDTSKPWTQAGGRFSIPGNAAPADQHLISPPLMAAMGADLVIALQHRYRFETSMGSFFDGGVLEISADGGKTWTDIADKITVGGYGGTLDKDNPLGERRAFVGSSLGYPAFHTTTVNLGRAYQGREVRLRLRMACDEGTASLPWDVEEIAVAGIANRPFPARVAHRGMCVNRPPTADAGPVQTVPPGVVVTLSGSGKDPEGRPLTFRWAQRGGMPVPLSAPASAATTFMAPEVTVPTLLTFTLVVSDGDFDSAPSMVSVIVDPRARAPEPAGGCDMGRHGAGPAWAVLLGLFLLLARRRESAARR